MEEEKLFKKGSAAKAEDGSLALVNEKNEAFKVDEAVMGIWSSCDGISFNQLVTAIAEAAKMDPS